MNDGATPASQRPTAADVIACYRYILGREPESEAAIAGHLERAGTLAQLRGAFISSREFYAGNQYRLRRPGPDAPQPMMVETEAEPALLTAMLGRIAMYWGAIGQQAPHWSVLTQPRFGPAQIEHHKDEFYASGENDATLVLDILRLHGVAPEAVGHVVEFGCGVGRATLALARHFPQVVGCDVSAAHLDIAIDEARTRGTKNIVWYHSTPTKPLPDLACGLWFSRLVLQHNPPPVITWLLREAFRRLVPGGVALFQVPTHAVGYGFATARYLEAVGPLVMEMHAFPQKAVFRLAVEAGLEVLEVRDDPVVGDTARWVSTLFVMRRPAG